MSSSQQESSPGSIERPNEVSGSVSGSVSSGTHADGPASGACVAPEQLTVHEFLSRVVTSPPAQSAFEADPRAALEHAGLGDLNAADMLQAMSMALDFAPADVVEKYSKTLQSGLAKYTGTVDAAAISALTPVIPYNHATEIAYMSMKGHSPAPAPATPTGKHHHHHLHHHHDFGHGGDVDRIFMAKDSFNVIDVHDNNDEVLSHNTIDPPSSAADTLAEAIAGAISQGPSTLQHDLPSPSAGAAAVTSAVSGGVEQIKATAADIPVVNTVAGHLPSQLPTPSEAPAALAATVANGPEQIKAVAADIPVANTIAGHLPSQLPAPAQLPTALAAGVANGPEQIKAVAADIPVANTVASHLPNQLPGAAAVPSAVAGVSDHLPLAQGSSALETAAGHVPVVGNVVSHLPIAAPAEPAVDHGSLAAPVQAVADNVPVAGDVAGHLPLDGLHG